MHLISVVIPTCHRNDLLAKCLDCLAPGVQTLDSDLYEVIVTDDGSTSTAEEMVKASYPWVKWTQGPRRGPAANRNHGAKLTVAEWIAFTDDDCLPDPGWLEAMRGPAHDPQAVLEGRTTCIEGVSSPLYAAPVNETGGFLWSCNMMIHKDTFRSLGGFDESFPFAAMEDVDFRERAIEAGLFLLFVSNASVDHPPRWRGSGCDRAKKFESYCAYCRKRGRRLFLPSIVLVMAYNRLKEVVKQPGPGLSAFHALGVACSEVTWTLIFYSSWKKKYPAVFQRVHSA